MFHCLRALMTHMFKVLGKTTLGIWKVTDHKRLLTTEEPLILSTGLHKLPSPTEPTEPTALIVTISEVSMATLHSHLIRLVIKERTGVDKMK